MKKPFRFQGAFWVFDGGSCLYAGSVSFVAGLKEQAGLLEDAESTWQLVMIDLP